MPNATTPVEEKFRGSLSDVAVVLAKLSPLCQSVEELTAMVQLALENDGQLRVLQAVVMGKK